MGNVILGYDFGNVEVLQFDVIEGGSYLADIESAEIGVTKDGMGQKLNLSLRIVQAEKPEHDSAVGCVVMDFVSHHVNSAFRMKQLLEAAYGRSVTGTEYNPDDLVGKQIMVVVIKEKTINNNDRNRISRFNHITKFKSQQTAAGTTQPAPVTGSEQVSM